MEVKLIDRSASDFRRAEQGHEVAEYAETFLNLREAVTSRLLVRERRRFTIGMVEMVAVTWGQALRHKIAAMASELIIDFHCGSTLDQRQQVRSGALRFRCGRNAACPLGYSLRLFEQGAQESDKRDF